MNNLIIALDGAWKVLLAGLLLGKGGILLEIERYFHDSKLPDNGPLGLLHL